MAGNSNDNIGFKGFLLDGPAPVPVVLLMGAPVKEGELLLPAVEEGQGVVGAVVEQLGGNAGGVKHLHRRLGKG